MSLVNHSYATDNYTVISPVCHWEISRESLIVVVRPRFGLKSLYTQVESRSYEACREFDRVHVAGLIAHVQQCQQAPSLLVADMCKTLDAGLHGAFHNT